jgi:hypothetical protein
VTLGSKSRYSESLGLTIFVYIRPYIQANPECNSYKKALLKLAIKQRDPEEGEGFLLGQAILFQHH